MTSRSSHLVSAVIGGLLVGAMLIGVQVYANDDNNPATDSVPRAFSYQGHLDWDGLPVNGNTLMTFELYGAPDSTTAKWTETQTVPIFNGRFGAELGANGANPIEAAVYDAGPLFLGITVQRFDEDDNLVGDPVVLGNRQKINPVPYALWATQSSNLNVAGNATVEGEANVRTTLRVGNGQRAGYVEVWGPENHTGPFNMNGNAVFNGDASFNGTIGGNRVGGNGFDQFSDYNLLLYNSGQPRESYGIGIEPGTLAFHTNDFFNFYQDGVSRMSMSNGNMAVAGTITAQGGLKVPVNLRRTGPFQINGRDNVVTFNAGAPNERSFCSLTRVHLYDDNDDDDHMACITTPAGGNNWTIQSFTTATDHGTQNCIVHCLIWD